MFHTEAIKRFIFPFAFIMLLSSKDACCYIAILAFTALTWGKKEKIMCLGKGTSMALWAASEGNQGRLLACIKLFQFISRNLSFLSSSTSCPEDIGTSPAGVIQCSLPIELLGFTSAMCQTCNLALGKGVYSSPPPAVWNSLISSHCHTTASLQACL